MTTSRSNDQRPDLWSYACQQYPGFKEPLHNFQDKGLSVNDVLALSYARRYSLKMDESRWNGVATGRARRLLDRVRCIRTGLSKTSPLRQAALTWELELERWDLKFLELCLGPTESWHHQLPPQTQLLTREERHRLEELIRALSQ